MLELWSTLYISTSPLFASYLFEFIVGGGLVKVSSKVFYTLFVTVRNLARRSNLKFVLGDGQSLVQGNLRTLPGLSARWVRLGERASSFSRYQLLYVLRVYV